MLILSPSENSDFSHSQTVNPTFANTVFDLVGFGVWESADHLKYVFIGSVLFYRNYTTEAF